jgi:signal transduction histidine kinase/ligand-binding sensor domain-containing protein/AraC-like DNA-binding protein/ActR/RegA family two-component response regulator
MSFKKYFVPLCCLLANIIVGQKNNIKFENLDTFNGLSSSTCTEIFQDKAGFLWFGTIDGLNRYNGYEFEIFRSVLNDETSISNNRINAIEEDNEGNLWIGTNNGLNLFNKQTNKFLRIKLYKQLSLSNSSQKVINDLLYDGINNTLWVATNIGVIKIQLYDYNTNEDNFKFSYYINDETNLKSIDNNKVNVLLKDKDNVIWAGTDGQYLNRYNSKNNNFDRVFIDKKEDYELNHITKKVFIDADGDFWIGNDLSNLILWNAKQNTFKHISIVDKSIPIYDIYQDKNGLFWVSTDVFGLYLFNKKGDEVELDRHIVNNFSDPFSLPNNKPTKIFEDRKGIFWIGSYDVGVSKLNPSSSSFQHYYYKANKEDGLSQKTIQSVLQDSKDRIWISAYNGGLNLFNETENSFEHFSHFSNEKSALSSNKILYTFEDHEGYIWVCTLDGGVNKFNPETGKSIIYLHDDKDSLSIGQSSVWCGVEDSKNRIWFGLRQEGVSLYNPKNKAFKNYKSNFGSENTLVSNSIISMFIDSKDRLFIGTLLGLNVVDLKNINEYIPDEIDFKHVKVKGLIEEGVNNIIEDHYGNIWVGSDSGVYKLDSDLNLIHSYSSQTGLPNNLVVGIIEDDNNNIWVTTKSGLSLLNPETNHIINYNSHDGLQGSEFQTQSIEKTTDGRIIVGGLNGFNIFNPNDIAIPASVDLKPQISKLKLNNKTVFAGDSINNRMLLNKGISETQELNLKYKENYISLEFVALYFDNPEQVKYAYKMEGLDSDFINLGSNRVVNLSNLESGTYKFEVKATINGQWDKAKTSELNIKIQPPIWRSWWAYLIYIVLGVLIIRFLMYYYELKVQEEQEHELDQMKLQFFVNVSHEFRTPLTLILNPVDKILSNFNGDPEVVKTSALSIQRSARRLLHLVNQLLDYRKMDVGMAPLQFEKGDLVKFSEAIFSLFKDLAFKKEIAYNFNATSDKIVSLFDFDKVEKIITNLISNAIKFTNPGGEITVSINKINTDKSKSRFFSFSKGKSNEYVEIIIEDTGVGLDKEQIRRIFSRFYNLDTSKAGTGIGLNFTKGLVELHGGEISVESKQKKGTKFIVKLPLNIDAKAEDVENIKNEFLINSMKAVEYDMLISNDSLPNLKEDTEEEIITDDTNKSVILIVEDNKELRVHLVNDLKEKYIVKEAVNGIDGLSKVQKYLPDLVISDVMMPKMDGFEMCNSIKSEIETCHIPVILLTAKTLVEDRIEGYEHGADGYIGKPFVTNVLKARINNLLEAKKRLRQRFSEIGGIFPSSEVTSNNLDEAFLDKATKVIIENISDIDFKQGDLLSEMGIGRSQFYKKINNLTGSNPSNFIRTIRLRYAAELLVKNNYSIKEVSHMSGFNSTAYFSKTFKELFDVTPSQFIEQKESEAD